MSRRPVIVAAAVIAVLAIAAGAFWYRSSRADPASANRRDCGETYGALSDTNKSLATKRTLGRAEPKPDWDLVDVAERPDGVWAFIDDGSGVYRGVRMEGTVAFLDDPRGFAADVTITDARVPEGEERRRERLVFIGDKLWIEDAAHAERIACTTPAYIHSLLTDIEQSFGAMPFLDRLGKGGRDNLAPNINPGMRVLAKEIKTEVLDGVTMTTYEQHPVERYEQIRTRFTLDEDNQLRWAEAVDTTTDEVLYHRSARPAPDRPPIADPTGEPIISMNP